MRLHRIYLEIASHFRRNLGFCRGLVRKPEGGLATAFVGNEPLTISISGERHDRIVLYEYTALDGNGEDGRDTGGGSLD